MAVRRHPPDGRGAAAGEMAAVPRPRPLADGTRRAAAVGRSRGPGRRRGGGAIAPRLAAGAAHAPARAPAPGLLPGPLARGGGGRGRRLGGHGPHPLPPREGAAARAARRSRTMTMRGDDENDLREAFAVLRREDAKRVPAFEAVRARRRPRRLPPLGGLLAAASVAAAILAVVARRPDPPPMASMEEWIAPTDFLLETPGRDIVRTVPRIGLVPNSRSVSP